MLVSLFTNRVIDAQVALTGEITLRGRVLPVGGIRDKVLAAQRAGIRTVVLPKQNGVDLEEVPATIRQRLNFVLVEHMDEVLSAVLGPKAKRPAARRARGKTSASKASRRSAARTRQGCPMSSKWKEALDNAASEEWTDVARTVRERALREIELEQLDENGLAVARRITDLADAIVTSAYEQSTHSSDPAACARGVRWVWSPRDGALL